MKKEINQKKLRLEAFALVVVSLILLWVVGARYSTHLAMDKITVAESASDAAYVKIPAKIAHHDADEQYYPPEPAASAEVIEAEAEAEAVAEVLSAEEPEEVADPVITPVEEQPVVAQPVNGRYGDLLLSSDEIETIARLVKLEAGGECFEGQQAVAEVILNRVLSPSFPSSVYDVVYQTYPAVQFTPASSIPYTSATQTQYDAVNAALCGQNILPQQVLYFATSQNGRASAWGWIGNHCFCY